VRMPIAHGEGCWVADDLTLARIEANGQVVFRYTDARGAATPDGNPNGSTANIAGLANENGNVVGLMPHPERCSEELLGGTDGRRVLEALTASRHTGMVSASVQ
jgi:phosphoribosylformylglycinamidine synthase subunit PurQ / glutaminase